MSTVIPVEVAVISRRPIAQQRRVRAELFAALHGIAPALLPARYGTEEPPTETFSLRKVGDFLDATSVGAMWTCRDALSEGSIACRGESTHRFTSIAIEARCASSRLPDLCSLATIWSVVLDADLGYVSPSPSANQKGAYLTWYQDERTPLHWFNIISRPFESVDVPEAEINRIGTHTLVHCNASPRSGGETAGGLLLGEPVEAPWEGRAVPTLREAWQMVLGAEMPETLCDSWPLDHLAWDGSVATPVDKIRWLATRGFGLVADAPVEELISALKESGLGSPHVPPSDFVAGLADRDALSDFRIVSPEALTTPSALLEAVRKLTELLDRTKVVEIEVHGNRGVLEWVVGEVRQRKEFNYFPHYVDEDLLRALAASSVEAGGPTLWIWHLDGPENSDFSGQRLAGPTTSSRARRRGATARRRGDKC